MKKICLSILLLSILVGCIRIPDFDKNVDEPDQKDTAKTKFSVLEETLLFSPYKEEKLLHFSADKMWEITGAPFWCIPSQVSGTKGNINITLSILSNNTKKARNAVLTIHCGDQKGEIAIMQYPAVINGTITIPIPNDANIKSVRYAPLKYNKKMAYSFVSADGNNRPWCKLFKYIQGSYVNSGKFWHSNMNTTTDGFQPSRTLVYTDGCGVERRFPMANSIIPIRDRLDSEYPYDTPKPNQWFNYLVWGEIYEMLDFDGSIQFHNVREESTYNSLGNFFDKDDPIQVFLGLKEVQAYVKSRIGRGMTIQAVPDGNTVYAEAGGKFEDILMITGPYSNDVNLLTDNLYKLKRGIFLEENFDLHKANFESYYAKCNDSYYGWVLDVTHDVDIEFTPQDERAKLLDWVFDNHGKNGADDVWVATPDEIYQYVQGSKSTPLEYEVTDGKLIISLDISKLNNDFYWSEYTLLIDGLPYTEGMTAEYSDETIGFSMGPAPIGTMINVNYDYSLLTRTEKYTKIYETTHKEEDKRNALYFKNRLTPEKASPFVIRLQ